MDIHRTFNVKETSNALCCCCCCCC